MSDPAAVPRLALSITEAATSIGCCPRTLWTLIETEGLPVVRIGRRVIVPVAGLRHWLRKRQRPAGAGRAEQAG